jgi:uncharacterized OB-fold protein
MTAETPTVLPTPAPDIEPETEAFWAATLEGTLLLQRCGACGQMNHYPRFVCANCHATDLQNVPASGRGTLYSFSVTGAGILEYKGIGPYVLAMVELEEGPKMVTNIVDADPAGLAIGQPVEVVFAEPAGGGALPRFRPVPAGS